MKLLGLSATIGLKMGSSGCLRGFPLGKSPSLEAPLGLAESPNNAMVSSEVVECELSVPNPKDPILFQSVFVLIEIIVGAII